MFIYVHVHYGMNEMYEANITKFIKQALRAETNTRNALDAVSCCGEWQWSIDSRPMNSEALLYSRVTYMHLIKIKGFLVLKWEGL